MKKSIAKTLKQLRLDKGDNLKTVADALNFHPSTISKYENGTRKITHETLQKFADYYNVNISIFYDLKDDIEKTNTKTYTVKLPFITLPTYKDILLFAIASLGVIIYSLTESDFALLLFVFFFITLLIQKAINKIIKPSRPEQTFKLLEHETLFFEHPNDKKTFKKDKAFDIMIYLWFMFVLFFIIGSYFTQTNNRTDQMMHTTVFMANFALFGTLIILSVFNQTDKKVMPFDTTNTTLNTLKYRIFYSITTLTSFYLFLTYPFYKQEGTTNRLVIFLFILFYFIMTQFFTYTKFMHYKRYKLYKR